MATVLAKTCRRGHDLTPDNVYVKTGPNGNQWRQCKTCQREYGKARYDAMTMEERAAKRQSFPSRVKGKHYQRKYKYGLGEREYKDMLISQDGLCMICATEGATHVDHDHDTGKVRGILCGPCNRAIGLFKEDAYALTSAAAYVKGEY